MRIYFTADNNAEERLQKRFTQIIDILNSEGSLVMSNLAQKNIAGFTSQDMEKIGQTGEVLIERVDALVIEGTKNLIESGYLIALALAHKKPILYLIEKGKVADRNLIYLQKGVSSLLRLKNYSDNDLEKIVTEFVEFAERGAGKELPNIKFTLRITSKIERYLRWRTHNTKLTKADYLRNLLEDLIDKDEEYKKFIRHHDDLEF